MPGFVLWLQGRSHDAERGSSKAPADKRAARWRVIIVKRLGIRDEDILDMQLENKVACSPGPPSAQLDFPC